ncbi:MAG TPA: diacylglycerol kinase family protein [Anaerolineae bacterium]|nr:diacylglycerol kinase family protein [Anaerolineae bacterium]HID84027.1 diacylglycerol kinase family protein [Anaerolineales bacterium]HIQ08016.1 diacylglycerol kinase family protein [Anaerolineaceae bacterium]
MRDRLRSRLAAFRYAFQGLGHLWRTQPNARIHALATVLVVALAWWLRIDAARGALLSLVIGLVWMAEAFNTALEAAVDLCSPQPHPLAKVSKDVGAAAVLLAVFTAVAVGLLILGLPLLARLGWGSGG